MKIYIDENKFYSTNGETNPLDEIRRGYPDKV